MITGLPLFATVSREIRRKSDRIKIKVLESDSATFRQGSNNNLQSVNCKERHFLIEKKGDNNNLFCPNSGHRTPIRTIKHSRGLATPSIQPQTAIVQAEALDIRK